MYLAKTWVSLGRLMKDYVGHYMNNGGSKLLLVNQTAQVRKLLSIQAGHT